MRNKSADHVHRAMRKIDDPQQSENYREAQAQNRIERAINQT